MNADERIELLDKVRRLVGEHCNGYIFIADVEAEEFEEGMHESVMIFDWNGGVTLATGLLHRATSKFDAEDRERMVEE